MYACLLVIEIKILIIIHLGETQLKSIESEKDLGIIIDKNFKFTEQCS